MSEYMRILKMIEDNEISLEEGIIMLQESGGDQGIGSDGETNPLDILSKIESGELSADEGVDLIKKTHVSDGYSLNQTGKIENMVEHAPSRISEEELERWKKWWTIPFYIGIGVVILSSFWLNSAYQNSQFGFWFFCSWIPLLIGLLIMALSWNSKSGPWIHVRVRGPKERVAISIPAPMGITSWALRNFGHHIPRLDKTSIDEIILALQNTTKNGTPLYVHVDEGQDGEQVEVFIG